MRTNRDELARALRRARERVSPEDVGLPVGSHRRVAGLRREEVAMLAGISVDYVVRLEQGRSTTPSAQVVAALQAEDPGSRAVPYCLSAGTDNKSFSLLGIRGFGFAPSRMPADLDFTTMFHGVDERVPVDSLQFGTRVLDRFLATS